MVNPGDAYCWMIFVVACLRQEEYLMWVTWIVSPFAQNWSKTKLNSQGGIFFCIAQNWLFWDFANARKRQILVTLEIVTVSFCRCAPPLHLLYLCVRVSECESEWVWECVWFSTSFVRLVERCHPLSPSPSLATTLSLSPSICICSTNWWWEFPLSLFISFQTETFFCPHSIAGESQIIFSVPPFFEFLFSCWLIFRSNSFLPETKAETRQ